MGVVLAGNANVHNMLNLVGGAETADDGAVHDDVTLEESAMSADLKECEESSGKHLRLTYIIIAFHIFALIATLFALIATL